MFDVPSAFGDKVSMPLTTSTVSGGKLVDSTVIGGGDADNLDLEDLNLKLLPRETLTIAVRAVSGTASVDGALSWKEDK